MMTILTFFVALGILVLVHEWGHYIVAKLSGVWVEKFSIGFGPKIIGFHKNGTDYRLAPIPLGGYVKLYGQDPLEEAEGDEKKAAEIANDPRAFHSKPFLSKLATVLAGPVMNFVLCLFIMPLVFMIGRLQPKILDQPPVLLGVEQNSPAASSGLLKGDLILAMNDEKIDTWQNFLTQIALHPNQNVTLEYYRAGQKKSVTLQSTEDKSRKQTSGYLGVEPFGFFANEPMIDSVLPNSPAAKAGMQSGDRVVKINSTDVETWSVMTDLVQKNGQNPMDVLLLRNGAEAKVTLSPEYSEETKTFLVGITKKMNPDDFVKKRYGFLESIQLGTAENFKLLSLTVDIVKRLFTGSLSYKSLGGPIQIAKATSAAAESGMGEFIYLLAFLSLQLGVLNLLPIPVLDGGHVVFIVVEALRRKPLSPKFRQISMQIGMAMLLGLMLVVTFNDINTTWGFANIFSSLKNLF